MLWAGLIEDNLMLAIRLPHEIEERLSNLAKKTGRTKTFYAKEAILEHLEELEDRYLAETTLKKIKQGKMKTYSMDEVRKDLDLDD